MTTDRTGHGSLSGPSAYHRRGETFQLRILRRLECTLHEHLMHRIDFVSRVYGFETVASWYPRNPSCCDESELSRQTRRMSLATSITRPSLRGSQTHARHPTSSSGRSWLAVGLELCTASWPNPPRIRIHDCFSEMGGGGFQFDYIMQQLPTLFPDRSPALSL
ncbi:hypothetical protein BO78DRAFT_398716, partial [Aspergillus sclerotiicarbonarius CBS 121057]